MLGGLGICGRPFCCSSFLSDFQPVSIKMAKEQGLSLNPTKISGTCGRLMCCLKYEQNAYEDLIRTTPQVGSTVNTPDGVGTVVEIVNILTGNLKVKFENGDSSSIKSYLRSEITTSRDEYNRAARENKLRERQEQEEYDEEEPENEQRGQAEKRRRHPRHRGKNQENQPQE